MSKLRVEGEVESPQSFGFEELRALPDQIEDVSRVVPGKVGAGVALSALLDAVGLSPGASHVYLEASDKSYQATLPLSEIRHAVLAYRLEGDPLPEGKGGPVRFLTPHDGNCDKADGHACANIKGLGVLRVTRGT
jgi:2-dehydropantoate 2-reductase